MTLVKGVANYDDDFTILCTSYHIQRYDRDQTKRKGLLYNWAIHTYFYKKFSIGLQFKVRIRTTY